jgi:hypothetical protein
VANVSSPRLKWADVHETSWSLEFTKG